MTECKHSHLQLLPKQTDRLRCVKCHLTIKQADLTEDYCPECFDSSGIKQYDFEKVKTENADVLSYRCEDCGIIVN